MILSVTLNPCIDHTLFTDGLKLHDRNIISKIEVDAGGKGINLSRMAVIVGGQSLATGFLGGKAGSQILHVLEGQGVDHDFVKLRSETRTNISLESGDGPPTVFTGPSHPIKPVHWTRLLEKVEEHCPTSGWVALGGSLMPNVPQNAYEILGDLAHKCGAKVMLDADGQLLLDGLKMSPDMLKPNIFEASRLVGYSIENLGDAIRAVTSIQALMIKSGAENPIATLSLGDKGALLAHEDKAWYAVPPIIEAKSTIGSGDSFLGAFIVANVAGKSIKEALTDGVAAGSATALSDGAGIGTLDDFLHLKTRICVLERSEIGSEGFSGWPYLGHCEEVKQGLPHSFDA